MYITNYTTFFLKDIYIFFYHNSYMYISSQFIFLYNVTRCKILKFYYYIFLL